MALNQIEIGSDVVQGFNLRKDANVQLGFLSTIKIGTTTLAADLPPPLVEVAACGRGDPTLSDFCAGKLGQVFETTY